MSSAKFCQSNGKLPAISNEIVEVKKRIQLSEGQRKALCEEIERRNERDVEEKLRLKQQIAALTIAVHEHRANYLADVVPSIPPPKASSAPCCLGARNVCSTRRLHSSTLTTLRALIGTKAAGKSLEEIVQHLDLQRIDKQKQLDLLNYRYKQKESKLKQLAEAYAKQLMQNSETNTNDEARRKQEFRNRINALQVQIRQAAYVRMRYKEIRLKLIEDAAKFERKMSKIEEELHQQEIELVKIKQENSEAVKLRAQVRDMLQKEEKRVIATCSDLEKQSAEGKRLLEAQIRDLQQIDRFTDNTKLPVHGNAEENIEKDIANNIEMRQTVEALKSATGSSSLEQVLDKVKEQINIHLKLTALRKSKEDMKNAKQIKYEAMLSEFEKLKFTQEGRQARVGSEEKDEILTEINAAQGKQLEIQSKIEFMEETIKRIVDKLYNAYICTGSEEVVCKPDPLTLIRVINDFIKSKRKQQQRRENTIHELLEEVPDAEAVNCLPEPYKIVRRTPQGITNIPSPVPQKQNGSEDDDELPTRGYLKRQAQLVVDAKNKRKTMRFQIAKTK